MSRIERAMALLRWGLVIASGAVAIYSVARYALPSDTEEVAIADARFHCPMHPRIRSHDRGTCPICHMQLEPIPEAMHDDAVGSDASTPPGFAQVVVTLERQRQFGIATVAVARRALGAELRLPAVVEARPGSVAEVHTRVPAFIERIVVDRVGAHVRRGQTLATAFSPEVARLGDELALAASIAPEFGGSLESGTRAGLVRAGVDPSSAASIPADRRGRFAITAPRSGFLTRVGVPVGAYAAPDVVLFELADLDPVLAIASIDDSVELDLERGSSARFESSTGTTTVVTLDSVEPAIDPSTRTRRIRFSVPNPESNVLPGGIGTLLVTSRSRDGLVVPADAVLDDGTRTIVFVDRGDGRFEPRSVEVLGRAEGMVGIVSGLREGERVVVRGGFLLDSESRLNSASREANDSRDAGATP